MRSNLKIETVWGYYRLYPEMPKLRLAKLIYKECPEMFTNVEGVRSIIRYLTGSNGKRIKEYARIIDKRKQSSWNEIPEGEKELDWDNPTLIDGKSLLVVSDIHIPYHDKTALITALKYGQDKNVDSVLINGDLMDQYHLSKFTRDPRKRNFKDELDISYKILSIIRSQFPAANIYFKIGNHDFRFNLYMMSKAPELYGIADFSLAKMLKLSKLKINEIGSREWAKFGKLAIAHGHEGGVSFSNPVSASRGIFLKAFQSILVGHHHQPSSYTNNTWSSEPITCWSTGCLCDLHPAYAPKNNWSHGFAIVNIIDDEGSYIVENKRIFKGKVYPV